MKLLFVQKQSNIGKKYISLCPSPFFPVFVVNDLSEASNPHWFKAYNEWSFNYTNQTSFYCPFKIQVHFHLWTFLFSRLETELPQKDFSDSIAFSLVGMMLFDVSLPSRICGYLKRKVNDGTHFHQT